MACPAGCEGTNTITVKASTQTKPKQTKGLVFGGSQISSLPTPKVTVKMY